MRQSTGPVFYGSKNAWFANLAGERIRLADGPNNREQRRIAQERYGDIVRFREAEKDGDKAEVWLILEAYLRHISTRISPPPLSPSSCSIAQTAIQSFIELFGRLQAGELSQQHIQDWLGKKKTDWNETTVKMYHTAVLAAFSWASGAGALLSVNPLSRKGQKIQRPEISYSVKRIAITEAEHDALCRTAGRRSNKNFLFLLKCLWHTGARPAEIYLVTRDEWNEKVQGFEIDPSDKKNIGRLKTRHHLRKSGRKRTLRIPDVLLPEIHEWMAGKLPIFHRERTLISWSKATFASRFRRLVQSANHYEQVVRKGLTGYSYRHSFVTRWLTANGNPMVLCELLNTSLEMLRRHYSHLFEDHNYLLNETNRFSGVEAGNGPRIASQASEDDQASETPKVQSSQAEKVPVSDLRLYTGR